MFKKMTPFHYLIIILLALAALATYTLINQKPSPTQSITLKIKDKNFKIELAQSMSQKSLGLGNRQSLCNNCGMLFLYKGEGPLPFWMKNTLIPLDMIWLNSKGTIVDIQTALPEPNTPDHQLKIYQNEKAAQYVLELNAYKAKELDLKIGDTITLPQY